MNWFGRANQLGNHSYYPSWAV